MNPTDTCRCPSDVDPVFVAAVKQMFSECMALERLELLALHLKQDTLATTAEKRLLRSDYSLIRKVLVRAKENPIDAEGGRILRKRRGGSE